MAATLPADSSPTAAKNMIKTSGSGQPRSARKPWADTLFALLARASALLTLALLIGIIVSLIDGAMAGDPRIRPVLPVAQRMGSGPGPVRRSGDDLRHADDLGHCAADRGAGEFRHCAVPDRAVAAPG